MAFIVKQLHKVKNSLPSLHPAVVWKATRLWQRDYSITQGLMDKGQLLICIFSKQKKVVCLAAL